MIGVIANTISVLIGSIIGLVAKKAIPESWNDTILKGMGMISVFIGVSGMLEGEQTLVLVLSIVIGAMIGQGLDIDGRFTRFSKRLEKKFDSSNENSTFAQGLITSSLIFCVGAMTIVGPMNAALKGDNDLLFTKTVMDGFTSIILAASLGFGVLFSAAVVLLLEGGIFLLASAVAPMLTTGVISELTCAGSLLIVALGLNLMKATDLKVMNYLPAIFLPIAFCPLMNWLTGLL
jgi:uncharacterized membrane protein YqgA involved in biofilm formation